MHADELKHRTILENLADQAMIDRGLLPDFSPEALAELDILQQQAAQNDGQLKSADGIRDLRHLLWASIDNDDSRDLDQLTVAEAMPDGKVKILVAVSDVDSLVKKDSAIDDHASYNTTSVYTAAKIFPMLPEQLSTNLTSLNPNVDRLAMVVEMVVDPDGKVQDSAIYQAIVHNQSQLAYNSVASWLDGNGNEPEKVSNVVGLAENLRIEDVITQKMKNLRHINGALSLETIEAKPLFDGDQILGLEVEEKNRAKEIIEDFMIAANGVVARYLESRKFPSIRRVVRIPKRWDRIVEIAYEHGYSLPDNPDAKSLENFLDKEKAADPLRFPDLSLVVIKLLGAGEYVADFPGDTPPGHFGLAVKDYTHSTAPNRRFTDLLTQRLLKAALHGTPAPYSKIELEILAKHCTEAEDAANKVERQVEKSAAALLLESRIGERFDAIVTGASPKGTWVRLLTLPVEGKLVHGFDNMDVGQRLRVQLISVDVDRGFIDFKKAS
jgi:VacB/RNase II family 3'-5' exoribonuclease